MTSTNQTAQHPTLKDTNENKNKDSMQPTDNPVSRKRTYEEFLYYSENQQQINNTSNNANTNQAQTQVMKHSKICEEIAVDDRSDEWNSLHFQKCKLIFSAMKNADLCKNCPSSILATIAILTVSIPSIKQCIKCKMDINVYAIDNDIKNDENDRNLKMRDFYLDDDDREIIVCKQCIQYLITCKDCKKYDIGEEMEKCSSCKSFFCRRHEIEDIFKEECDECEECNTCVQCTSEDNGERYTCKYCGDSICDNCKIGYCQACISYRCWFHECRDRYSDNLCSNCELLHCDSALNYCGKCYKEYCGYCSRKVHDDKYCQKVLNGSDEEDDNDEDDDEEEEESSS